jgi:hypothetical protein
MAGIVALRHKAKVVKKKAKRRGVVNEEEDDDSTDENIHDLDR